MKKSQIFIRYFTSIFLLMSFTLVSLFVSAQPSQTSQTSIPLQSFTKIGSNFDTLCYDSVCTTKLYSYEKYFERNGVWETVDEDWHACENNFCTNDYYFNATADNQGTVTANLNNQQLSFQLSNLLNSQLSFNPTIQGSVLTYENIVPNVDLQYQYLPKKLKEEIVIKQPLINLVQDNFNISFTKLGDADFVVDKPYICENGGHCKYINYQINSNDVIIEIPASFLNNPNNTYPIIIDPSIVLNEVNIKWNGRVEEDSSGDFGSVYVRTNNPKTLYLGSTTNGGARGDIDWNVGSIPDKSTILDATLRLFIENYTAPNFINITAMEKNSSQWPDNITAGNLNFYTDMQNGTVYANASSTFPGSNFAYDFVFNQTGISAVQSALTSDAFSVGVDTDLAKKIDISGRDNANANQRPIIIINHTYREYNLTYDGNGNLIQGFGKYFYYDGFNRLKLVRLENSTGNKLSEYWYEPDGNRLKKIEWRNGNVSDNETTYYPFKEWVQVRNSSGIFNYTYYYLNDKLVAHKAPDGKRYFYHSDHLGSTTLVTNESGDVVEDIAYLPYGVVYSGPTASRYLFTGKELDKETALEYFGARYYDPEFMHFVAPDSVISNVYDPQSLNRYVYVLNNPVKYVDPNGLWAVQFGGQAQGGIVGLLTGEVGFYYVRSDTGENYYGFYKTSGAGVALVPNVEGGVAISGTFSPHAQTPNDLVGENTNIEGSILVGTGPGAVIGGGVGFDDNYKNPSSYNLNIGAGGKGIPVQETITRTKTETISLRDAIGNVVDKIKESFTNTNANIDKTQNSFVSKNNQNPNQQSKNVEIAKQSNDQSNKRDRNIFNRIFKRDRRGR